jgi:cation diffusion facilitator CzcD-associated flavoprotein CzcO
LVETETLIIGAGPAGLAVAGRLRQSDLDFVLIEKSDRVGDSWHRHYERLHLHTVKELSHLPGLEFPDDYPRYVPRQELADYYADYARRFSIEPRFGEEAKTVRRFDRRWLTTTGSGLEILADNVVIATGLNQAPYRPTYPGAESFTGRIVHSKDYRNADPFHGETVLVVGMGNTGAEIALDLSEAGVDTTISVRGPVNIVPRDVLGRPTQLTARMLARLPVEVGDRLGMMLRRMTVGDLTPYGIATPDIAPLAQLRERGKTPVIDVGTVEAIKTGRISVRPAVDHFEGDHVVFADRREGRYDSLILATGYRPMLADLVPDGQELLDEKGLPRHASGDGPHSGLFFVGFDNHRPGGVLGTVVKESAEVVDRIRGSRASVPGPRSG